MTIKKIIALVNALAKLHNFCIDIQEENEVLIDSSEEDLCNIMDSAEGFVTLNEIDGVDTPLPSQLLDGGNHFLDVPQTIRRRYEREQLSSNLPRTELLMKVINSNMDRPSSNRR
jgi:hypothetical protein